MKRIIVLFALMSFAGVASAQTFRLASPDSRQEALLSVSEDNGRTSISYQTTFDGRPVILPSVLDLTIDNHIWERALAKKAEPVDSWFDNLVYDSHEKKILGGRLANKTAFPV